MKRTIVTIVLFTALPFFIFAQHFYNPIQINTDKSICVYTYDDAGNPLSWVEEKWDSTWKFEWARNSTYDLSGNQLTQRTLMWSDGWINHDSTTYTYDNAGNMLSFIMQNWFNNAWQNSSQRLNTYDGSSNLLTSLYQSWTTNGWQNSERNIFTYDDSSNMLTKLYQKWSNDIWQDYTRNTYTYHSGNLITNVLEQRISNVLKNVTRLTYAYNTANQVIFIFNEYWVDTSWQFMERISYKYNSGRLSSKLTDHWSNGAWDSYSKITYSYDTEGNMLEYCVKYWQNGAWQDQYRDTYTYDLMGNILTKESEEITGGQLVKTLRVEYIYNPNGSISHGYSYKWINNSWIPFNGLIYTNISSNELYNYSFWGTYLDAVYQSVNGTEDKNILANSFKLQQNYPNPFNPSTTIRYSTAKEGHVRLVIYDVLGAEAAVLVNEYKPAGSYSVHFDGSSLSSGVYFYRLESNGFSATKKLILVK